MDNRVQNLIFAVFATVALLGCVVPLPPRYGEHSRHNLPETIPEFIKPHETTREDVMMHLGEPDSVAEDESWIGYGSEYMYGGVAFVVALSNAVAGLVSERVRYRRLIVPFDPNGFALQPIFETQSCGSNYAFAELSTTATAPCLDIWGQDLPKKFGMSPPRP